MGENIAKVIITSIIATGIHMLIMSMIGSSQ